MIIRGILVWFLCTAMSVAAEVRTVVAFTGLPVAVQKTVQKLAGNGAPGEIERVEDDGEVSYEGDFTVGGRKRDFTVGEDGILQSLEMMFTETPPAVQRAVRAQVGAGKLVGIDKTFDYGDTSYDVTMTAKDGQERVFTVEENGTISSLEVGLAETPPAVQKTVTDQVGAGSLVSITKTSDDGIAYEVEMTVANGKEREFSVGDDGKLVSVRVVLEETPAEVQKTIREQIGTGKILRIDKTVGAKKRGQSFDVEGRKDGKRFDFSVGPKGKFLGMDE